MKHLKKFNESLNKEDLQDFCENYLAYLLDEGYSIESLMVSRDSRDGIMMMNDNLIIFKKGDRPDDVPLNSPEFLFSWDEIKDQFIPFIHMLSKRYTIIGGIKIWLLNKKMNNINSRMFIDYEYNLSMIFDDKISLEEISQISIHIR